MTDYHDIEPAHGASATEHVLSELQLFGYRPFDDQPDPRPLPEGKVIAGAVADIFDALVATLNDTRLEPTWRTCSGRPSTSSIVPPTASDASSTTTNRRNARASASRTARRCSRSNLSA
jgi:hypothetical protein